jgi:8-oxo-dGTP diphosphatase
VRSSDGSADWPDRPRFALAVDAVVLTIADDALQVLLVERAYEPLGWALPGGFVNAAESLDQAVRRELREETDIALTHLEQLQTYGAPDRDPRERVISVAYLALVPAVGAPTAGSDAARAAFFTVEAALSELPLAFDHATILADGVERARSKLEYTSLATSFCPPHFTMAELRRVYEIVWNERLEPANFRRKVLKTPGFVIGTGRRAQPGVEGGKPAELYRAGDEVVLQPPLRRAVEEGLN